MFWKKTKEIKQLQIINRTLKNRISRLEKTINNLCKHEHKKYFTPTGIEKGSICMIVCCKDCERPLPEDVQEKIIKEQLALQDKIAKIDSEARKWYTKSAKLQEKLLSQYKLAIDIERRRQWIE